MMIKEEKNALRKLCFERRRALTPEEREAFIASHPNCEVLFRPRGSSTYGTWRSHPRYAQYRRMFETGVWKEFE